MSSLLGARNYNDSFMNISEVELDANAVITELDKGLRSPKLGEQCEAIVRCPKLFEKLPFPVLINSLFLKLADVFRFGSNLLRLWVLRVCQQSERHLDKVLNVEEFMKRIYTVMHMNDPVARALTLRTLGAVAGIIPENQQVHHAIRRSLDSHDAVEVDAAIQASVQFAAQSKTFAISMCSKMASMIESLQIPISMKLQVIPVLRHMHHDANTAALVKTLCIELLPKYPSESFVVVVLDSLTQLSLATLVDIPDQVTLLLTYLQDPRRRIRYSILRSMQLLARKGAHLWPKGALQTLITKAMACNDQGNEQSLVLSVVRTLTECPVTCNALLADEQHLLLELCSMCLVLEHHTAASQAVRILTGIVSYCQAEKIAAPVAYMTQIDLHLESLIYASLTNEQHHKELTNYLLSGVKLAEKNAEFGDRFVQLVGGILADDFVYPPNNTTLITETLGALCSQFLIRKFTAPPAPSRRSSSASSSHLGAPMAMDVDQQHHHGHHHHQQQQHGHPQHQQHSTHHTSGDAFKLLLPSLLRRLDMLIESYHANEVRHIEILAAVCLQSMLGTIMSQRALDTFDRLMRRANYWTQYRVARSASRYGHHYLAARIYTRISGGVSVEKLHFFLCALAHISMAECVLIYGCEYHQLEADYELAVALATTPAAAAAAAAMTDAMSLFSLSERLERASALYAKALATLKASSSPTHPLAFHSEFVRLRGQLLEALHGVVIIKNTQNIAPPPAIAHTLAQNSRDYLQKFGHVTNQLRKMVKTIKFCEDAYSKLYKSVFDADTCTLEYLEITKSACIILGHSVESLCFASPSDLPSFPTDSHYPETNYLIGTCLKMKREMAALPLPEPGVQKAITPKHTDTIVRQIETLLRSPMCMPRFYFQVLQSTNMKLAVTPQPRVPGDPVQVAPGSNLVVKVEGLFQHTGRRPNQFRAIDSVQLTLTSQLISAKPTPLPPSMCGDYKSNNPDTVQLTQTVRPHRDFISGSFLVPLNNSVQTSFNGGIGNGAPVNLGGHWQVTLETCVLDSNSVLWNTGPKSTMLVRVPEDMNKSTNAGVGGRRY